MLKKFKVNNFQSHKETSLEFVPGVNVIWGVSQHGKTAILRALSLLITNRPLGGRFFSDFAGKKGVTELSLTLEEGISVGLKKNIVVNKEGKKEVKSSAYSLDGQEGDYGAFGDKIPDKIEALLNFSDLNVQKQFDEPFLICSTAGEVAKVFNKATRLEKVDPLGSELTSRVNTNRNEIKILDSQQKQTGNLLKKYENVLVLEREVQRSERLAQKIKEALIEIEEITKKREKLLSKQKELSYIRKKLEIEPMVKEAEIIFAEMNQRQEEISRLNNLIEQFAEIEADKQYYKAIILAEELVEESLELVDLIKEKEKEVQQVGQILGKVTVVSSVIEEINFKMEDLVSGYVTALKELGKCPTCFSIIDEKTINEIVKEINGETKKRNREG